MTEQVNSYLKSLTINDDVVGLDDIIGLLKLVGSDNKSNATIMSTLADWAREENNRNEIAKNTNVIDTIVTLLTPYHQSNNIEVDNEDSGYLYEMICRCLGNLTYEHEDNRKIIEENNGLDVIAKSLASFVKQTGRVSLRKTSCAAIANLTSCTEFFQKQFFDLQLIPSLFSIVSSKTIPQDIKQWALTCLKNTIDENDDTQVNIKHSDILILSDQLTNSLNEDGWIDNTFANELVNILSILALNDDLRQETVKEGLLVYLLDLIDNAESQRKMVEDLDDEEIKELKGEISVASLSAGLISKLSESDEIRPSFLDNKSVINRMIQIISAPPPTFPKQTKQTTLRALDIAKTKRLIVRAIAYVSLENNAIDILIPHIELFVQMFKVEDTEQLVSAAMFIGNIANSEKNSKILITLNVIDVMAECMKTYPNHQPVQHLILSAIRNITNGAFKGQVASQILIECIVANLRVPNQVIQFTALQVLKHIILCNEQNFFEFIKFRPEGSDEAYYSISSLLDLANCITKATIDEEEEKKPRDLRVSYEASRILARFLLVCKDEKQKEFIAKESVKAFYILSNSPYGILRCEGARAVRQVSQVDIHAIFTKGQEEQSFDSLLESINTCIKSTLATDQAYNREVQSIFLDLLLQLSKNEIDSQKLKSYGAIGKLRDISNTGIISTTSKSTIQQILVQLTI